MGDRESVGKLLSRLQSEGQEILDTLRGLEDEIGELKNQESELRDGDLTLEDLESKFRKHLVNSSVKP